MTWTPEREQDLLAMRESGATNAEMARKYGMSRGGISAKLRRLDQRKVQTPTPADVKFAAAMRGRMFE